MAVLMATNGFAAQAPPRRKRQTRGYKFLLARAQKRNEADL